MKTLLRSAAAATLLMLAIPGVSLAQRATGGYGVRYDAQTIWTVSGEVMSVSTVASRGGRYGGVHLLLKTDRGNFEVHLGPSWFVDRQTMKVVPHDVIEVTGSPVIYQGKPALIAAEVRKGSEKMQLRTAGGVPLWSRSRGR